MQLILTLNSDIKLVQAGINHYCINGHIYFNQKKLGPKNLDISKKDEILVYLRVFDWSYHKNTTLLNEQNTIQKMNRSDLKNIKKKYCNSCKRIGHTIDRSYSLNSL
jgi:hypothetical protein